MAAKWQKNQNGTYYADHHGFRISVKREAPRVRRFCARIEGLYIGTFGDLVTAMQAADLAAEQRAGVE